MSTAATRDNVQAIHVNRNRISPVGLTAEDLRWATEVAEQLQHRGIGIYGCYFNGQRVVLLVERAPDKLVTDIAMRRRVPRDGGWDRTLVAHHLGVQLEWTVFTPAGEVRHA